MAMTATTPNKQIMADAVIFLFNMAASSDLSRFPVFVPVVLQTTSSAGNA